MDSVLQTDKEVRISTRLEGLLTQALASKANLPDWVLDWQDKDEIWHQEAMELYFGALRIIETIYGAQSHQVSELKNEYKRICQLKHGQQSSDRKLITAVTGILRNAKHELNGGLLNSLEKEVSAEVLTDFILFAKSAYSEGTKDVSAVLACAALEDALKKFAEHNGLSTTGKGMTEIANALKSKGLVSKGKHGLLLNYAKLRNNAFHADWSSFDKSEVGSIISFTEAFLWEDFR